MKHSLTVILLVVNLSLTSNLFAEGLRAGAAKVDITPPEGVSLDGSISKNGPVTGVHDPLHARALVLADDETRIAIVIVDACMVEEEVFDDAKKLVHQESGFPTDHMLMAATHTHAAPRLIHIGTEPIDDQYHRDAAQKIAQAVLEAEKHLVSAQLGHGSFRLEGLIACRRFLCEPGTVAVNPFGESGERIKSVAGKSTGVIEPAGPVDPEFSVISVQDRDGHQIAALGNFSVHYCGGYRRGMVSADYFGQFSEQMEAKLSARGERPAIGLMSNGTSGNTGAFQNRGRKFQPFEGMEYYGRMMAERSAELISKLEHKSDLDIEMQQTDLTLNVRKPSAERIAWAKEIVAHPDKPTPHRWSKIYADETLHLSRFPEQKTIKIQAIKVGDLAIASAPCEVFAETGLALKKRSPHPKTIHIELANGYAGYLPPKEQHELGGYETWPARSSFLEVDAARKILETQLQLLEGLK
ncbi:MAG: neutral/alkaline non-lysosomal ceramidase N-terminal domain-containing protein [Planctomycetaceae bacterium]|nr:neutral/alkaline non-lysosomal ceramidase N-terminal domain-containing protein [Planctomycetaceae bacterium]